MDYEICEEVERCIGCLLEVGISIVDVFPLKALEKVRLYPQSKEMATIVDKMISDLKDVVDSY